MLLPASMAGLPLASPSVNVGPPWSASGVNIGSERSVSPGNGDARRDDQIAVAVDGSRAQ